MQEPGIEPGAQRWQRWILPLNHSCNHAIKVLCCNLLYNQPCSLSDLQGLVLLVVYYLGGCAPSWH